MDQNILNLSALPDSISITKKLGKGINEILRELKRKEGESIDDYMERTLTLLIEVLSEIAVSESVIYPNLGVGVSVW